jgi:hypothetical protein
MFFPMDAFSVERVFEPFEILRHSNQESYRKEKENGGSGRDLGIWLPRSDSNSSTSCRTLNGVDPVQD